MNTELSNTPIVLCFSGLDPSGGAGIQADIETLASLGCHCAPIVTALTAQDTENVKDVEAIYANFLIEQARVIFEDYPVAAIKIGLLGSVEAVEAIHTLLMDYPDIPVVLDPVLAAGGGTDLSSQAIIDAMINLLLPQMTIITPNSHEARELSKEADSLEACASCLMEHGSQYVLVTGAHENTSNVIHKLWGNRKLMNTFECERLPHEYHGSGCTLASAIAAYLAHGTEIVSAVRSAQTFTYESLKNAQRLGMGQLIPRRLFWTDNGNRKQIKSGH